MFFEIRGDNFELTDAIRNYVEEKVSVVEDYFNDNVVASAHVNLKVYRKNKQKVEVTIKLNDLVIRAEDTNLDVYTATDSVVSKIERQIRKHKTKVNRKFRTDGSNLSYFTDNIDNIALDETESDEFKIGRRKEFELKPMDTEEAILQLNLLGHDFFVYMDIVSGNVCVVYVRADGTYGVIEAT